MEGINKISSNTKRNITYAMKFLMKVSNVNYAPSYLVQTKNNIVFFADTKKSFQFYGIIYMI